MLLELLPLRSAKMHLHGWTNLVRMGRRAGTSTSRRGFSSTSPSARTGRTSRNVVALESTVITHGMPYPDNVRTAVLLEDTVKQHGSVPRTVAIMDGEIKIAVARNIGSYWDFGLTPQELDGLARVKGAVKVSRRDLSHVVAKKLTGGTTVSATMILAHQAGITLFATGGIGGVHRDGQSSMDISADLTELGRTPVTVVCAGVKSILDIGRTLEYLETQGVCVATIGPTNDFPSFFSRRSGYSSPCHVRDEKEAAELIFAQEQLDLESGILLAVPIPEENEIATERVESWLYEALLECKSKEVTGRDVTPYLLRRLNELSNGATLKANIALIKNNAAVAAKIAVHLEALRSKTNAPVSSRTASVMQPPRAVSSSASDASGPVVIGGSVLDIITKCSTDFQMNGSTHAGEVVVACGGVGRNIADCLARLGTNSHFLSAVGDDYNGRFIRHSCSHMDLSKLHISQEVPTSCYVGLLAKSGQLLGGVMNLAIHELISPDYVSQHGTHIRDSPLMVLDGNLSVETLDYCLELAGRHKIPVFYEPTDISKATKPFQTPHWQSLAFLSPNMKELEAIMTRLGLEKPSNFLTAKEPEGSQHAELFAAIFGKLPALEILLIKLGKLGSLVVSRTDLHLPCPKRNSQKPDENRLYFRHYQAPPVPSHELISVSGSGDCMAAGLIWGILQGKSVDEAVDIGTSMAAVCLKSTESVPVQIKNDIIEAVMQKKSSVI